MKMNPQLAKEFRAIFLPWSAALVLALLIPLGNFLVAARVIGMGAFNTFLFGLAVFAFFATLLAIAASPFGIEFHNRTLPLLLSQPISRGIIWKQKLIAMLAGIGTALLVLVLANALAEKAKPKANGNAFVTTPTIAITNPPVATGMTPEEIYRRRYGINVQVIPPPPAPPPTIPDVMTVPEICFAVCALLLPTLSSVTFWTLVARSTIGGMVFTAFSQLMAYGILAFTIERLGISDWQLGYRDLSLQTAIFAVAGIIYSGIFFWLSWSKFARLQVNQISSGTLAGSKSLSALGLRLDWLRCRPTSASLNLIRKEIQLQKPLFLIAGILCVLWLLTYVLLVLQPSRLSFPGIIFALTIGLYIPLVSLLAGCISLGEEKNLGVTAWYLTFPVSIWRQWAAKLVVGLSVWIFLGFILPFGLTRIGLAISSSRNFLDMELRGWFGFFLFTTGLFALSFWAMTLFSNSVRAVIGSIATVVGLCSAAALAYWNTVSLVMHDTILRTLLIDGSQWKDTRPWILLGGTTVILALFQSVRQFRSLQASSRAIVKSLCALIVFIFLATTVYYLLLPILQCAQPVYLLLFILLLLILRRKGATIPQRAVS